MRISDWSSDVCSSDLIFADLAPALDSLLPPESKGNDGVGRLYQGSAGKWTDFAGRCRSAVALRDQPDGEEIGRASCRERVRQYVELMVVAGSVKTKKVKL